LSDKQARISLVEPGEFVLGYPDERDTTVRYPAPLVQAGPRDLARNGTYLVFRQLAQHVTAFEAFTHDTAERIGESEEWVASRLIGRHRSGVPLVPGVGSSRDDRKRNDFLYVAEDPSGLACPLGAHIRRANPRDSVGPDPETALRLSRMHRIIRRGRSYGHRHDQPATDAASMQEERGIHFICLNASISGQFELIQHSWINNPHFGGLYDEADPISHDEDARVMTIQSRPTHWRLQGIAPFTTVRGGAYFFMPGIGALQALVG
jgi:Dyp-type peroxidase family